MTGAAMKRVGVVVSVLVLAASGLAGKKKQKSPLPAIVARAQYVAIVPLTADGHADFFSTQVTPEDRRAAYALQQNLLSWNRYHYVLRPEDADLVIAVRAGRLGSAYAGPQIGIGNNGPSIGPRRTSLGHGGVIGGDAGPSDDSMVVFVGHDPDSAPVWIRGQWQGLEGNQPLFQQFKKDIEKTDQVLAQK
jgi:hypothetical protein